MEPKDDRPTAVAKGKTDSCGLGTLGRHGMAGGASVHPHHGSMGPGTQLSWEQECEAPGLRQKEAPS